MAPDTHRRTLLAAAASLGGSILLAGCRVGSEQTGGEGPVLASGKRRVSDPDVTSDRLETLVAGNTSFAFDLFHYLIKDAPETNVFVSPYSVSIALAMTWAGARGTTETRMADTMHFSLDQTDLHPAFNQLDQTIQQRGERNENRERDEQPFELRLVNALWGQTEYPFRDAYLDTLAVNYGAGLRLLDFQSGPEAARTTINEWVANQTGDRIKDLFPPNVITEVTRFVLTNAIYFKADWMSPFPAKATTDGQFTALDGSATSVSLMRQGGTFPYAQVDGHQLIELPYVGDDVGMIVILPAAGTFEAFEQSLDTARLDTLLDALEAKWGSIHLPRFTYKSAFKLKDALSALGMPVAFDPATADFGGMADLEQVHEAENLFIQAVVHQSHIAVDEEGTEAAAATGVGGAGGGAPPTVEFEMVVDRPFVYLIRDRGTGTILFLGRVVDAGAARPT